MASCTAYARLSRDLQLTPEEEHERWTSAQLTAEAEVQREVDRSSRHAHHRAEAERKLEAARERWRADGTHARFARVAGHGSTPLDPRLVEGARTDVPTHANRAPLPPALQGHLTTAAQATAERPTLAGRDISWDRHGGAVDSGRG